MRLAIPLTVLFTLACAGTFEFPAPQDQVPIVAGPEVDLPPAPTGPGEALDGGGTVHEITWSTTPERGSRFWVYTPAGERPEAGWPTVLIAPAGSPLITGMALALADRAEHLPYVDAGFQVVAYEIDGIGDEDAAIEAFAASDAGLQNARHAHRYATEVLPTDSKRVFAAGHSSAGDLALLFATHETGLAGAATYNTSGDGCWFQPDNILVPLSWGFPEFADACQRGRAANHVHHLEVPLLLFGSEEDDVVPAATVRALAEAHPDAPIEVRITPSGDHYTSMIRDQVPQAIQWMKAKSR